MAFLVFTKMVRSIYLLNVQKGNMGEGLLSGQRCIRGVCAAELSMQVNPPLSPSIIVFGPWLWIHHMNAVQLNVYIVSYYYACVMLIALNIDHCKAIIQLSSNSN